MITKEQLEKYGIMGASEVVYNPSYDQLFEEETKSSLEGFEKGQVSELGAVNVMTGIYTGRSPKDKWIVKDESSDILGLVNQINPDIPILAANFDFSSMKYEGLHVYEQGIVKEGVGAGGCAIAAIMKDSGKTTIEIIQKEIEVKYQNLKI